jgi:glutamine synthetase
MARGRPHRCSARCDIADGEPSSADPRHSLAAVVARYAARGLTPVVAVELEFYVLERGPDGRPRPARGHDLGCAAARRRVRARASRRHGATVRRPVRLGAHARAASTDADVQYSPGQFEITLEHRADALRAVDEAILFKRVVRGGGAAGLVASFMAKPFAERAGSGMHLHASVTDAEGRNLFADADPAGSALLRHAIGGLRDTMADGMGVFAPHANSYRRFRAMSYAPVAPTWGVNNRTVSLRVPSGPAETRHVEHRVAGADANPYLVAAPVLRACCAHRPRIDPGRRSPATAGAASDDTPTQWPHRSSAARSSFMADALGSGFRVTARSSARSENGALVTDRDYDGTETV